MIWRIDVAWRVDAHHLRHEGLILQDERRRDTLGPQDLLSMVDIMDEGVERPYPLLDAGRKAPPLCRREQPRDDIERDQPLIALEPAIDREGDAASAENRLGLLLVAHQIDARQAVQPGGDLGVIAADGAVRQRHLVNNALLHGLSRVIEQARSMVSHWRRPINPILLSRQRIGISCRTRPYQPKAEMDQAWQHGWHSSTRWVCGPETVPGSCCGVARQWPSSICGEKNM